MAGMRARRFPRCGAKTRKGTPCQRPPVLNAQGEPRNGRCRNHGGLSTGAKKRRKLTATVLPETAVRKPKRRADRTPDVATNFNAPPTSIEQLLE